MLPSSVAAITVLFQSPGPENTKYDVVIIGGGISGLYCAMKLVEKPELLRERTIKNMIILEKSDRWGGRLDTDIIDIKETDIMMRYIKEEEGAMRFTYRDPDEEQKSNMPLLSGLIKHLDMENEVQPFYMQPQRDPSTLEKGNIVPNCNARFFEGNHFTDWYATQNPNLWKNMFNLKGDEEFKSSGEIVKDIYRKLLDHNKSKIQFHFPKRADVILAQQDTQLLQEYEDDKYWAFFRNEFTWSVGMQELPLNEFSMPALLTAMGYSHGCCMMMVQTQGFTSPCLSKGNTGSILQELITFNIIWDNLSQFEKGWSSLVKRLMKYIRKASSIAGVKLELKKNCGVEEIEELRDEKGFTLTLGAPNETQKEIAGNHVVMAVPPKALKDIFNHSKNLEEKVIEFICHAVEGVGMTKINLYFDDDWWNQEEDTLMYGPNITSLPCGFVYPFYGECRSAGCQGCDKCKNDPCPAALTIYCDMDNSQFWSSLQRLGHKFQSPLQNQKGKLTPASEPVVNEAIRQLKDVFNFEEIPTPILTSYRNWDGEEKTTEYGYAIHSWGLGVDDRKVMKKVAQPIKGKNLYLCNEAWSGYQGWVEGSLESTEKAVSKLLGVEK